MQKVLCSTLTKDQKFLCKSNAVKTIILAMAKDEEDRGQANTSYAVQTTKFMNKIKMPMGFDRYIIHHTQSVDPSGAQISGL